MSSPPVHVDPAVIDRAVAVTRDLCDELRPRLLDQAGTIGSTSKKDGTPVTEIDLEVDRRIRARLLDAFPDHGVVSEEGDTVWPDTTWTWLVDPIDGTSNFTAGLPYWCVSIALLHEGVPVYGCIDAPPLDARFEAVRGGGATRNGAPIRVADPVDFRSGRFAHVPLVVTAGTIRRTSGQVRLNARILGSSALDLALVASGAVVAAYQRVPKAWDLAAGSLLVIEAGGAHVVVGDAVLPPAVGQDLATRSCESLAGPTEAWLRELHSAL